ncbi:MAG: riboflavin kinase [Caulobacter sp.]|nr:riboflavin kinase [Caulobacter sp.]
MEHSQFLESRCRMVAANVEAATHSDAKTDGATVLIAELDGIHHCHRKLIAAAAETAEMSNSNLVVLNFEASRTAKHQIEFERGRLMSRAQQARKLRSMGVHSLHTVPLAPDARDGDHAVFVRQTLLGRLNARRLVVGSQRICNAGGVEGLLEQAKAHGVSTMVVETSRADQVGEGAYAAARKALKAGRPDIAAGHLGHTFAIEGVVVEGQQLGRQFGFPTANISAGDYLQPALGVYATRTSLPDGRRLTGVANFGVNPTTGLVDARLEVHLLDFDEDLYGQILETELVAFLRPERKFDGLGPLIDQIRDDAESARAILGAPPLARETLRVA